MDHRRHQAQHAARALKFVVGNSGTLLTNWTKFTGIEESKKLGTVDPKAL
jgi:hypothetical protein